MKRVIVKPMKEREEKTAEEIKQTVKKLFAPTEKGLKVAEVRKGWTGLVMAFADENSWQTVVRSQKLKDSGLKADTLSKRMLRIVVYEINRSIEKEELTKVVYAQNYKKIDISKFKEEFVPMYRSIEGPGWRGAHLPSDRKLLLMNVCW